MYLSREEISTYKRALKKRQQLFSDEKLAIYVGKQCLRVMKRVALKYAREATWNDKLPDGYIEGFDYEISYVPR